MAYEPRGAGGDRGGHDGQDGGYVKMRGRRKFLRELYHWVVL